MHQAQVTDKKVAANIVNQADIRKQQCPENNTTYEKIYADDMI